MKLLFSISYFLVLTTIPLASVSWGQDQDCASAIDQFQQDLQKAQDQKDATAKAAGSVKKSSFEDGTDSGSDTGGGDTGGGGGGGGGSIGAGLSAAAKSIGAAMQAQAQGLDQLLQVDMKIAENESKRLENLLKIQRDFWDKEQKLKNEIRKQEREQRLLKVQLLTAETAFKNENIDIDQKCRTSARDHYNQETLAIQQKSATGNYIATDMTRASGTEKRRKERQVYFYRECMRDAELAMQKAYNKYQLAVNAIKLNSNEFNTAIDQFRTDINTEKEHFNISNTVAEQQYQISRNSLLHARDVTQQKIAMQQAAAALNAFSASAGGSGGGDTGKQAKAAVQKGSSCLKGEKVSAVPVDPKVFKEISQNLNKACGLEMVNRCFSSNDSSGAQPARATTSSGQ